MSEAALPPLRLGLVGSPNSGKTTLFNALTGLRAKTANFPGTTIERRVGHTGLGERRVRLLEKLGRGVESIELAGAIQAAPVNADGLAQLIGHRHKKLPKQKCGGGRCD